MSAQTLQQQRAKYALNQVQQIHFHTSLGNNTEKEFRSYAASLPAMIKMNGLGQAAAFALVRETPTANFTIFSPAGLLNQGNLMPVRKI